MSTVTFDLFNARLAESLEIDAAELATGRLADLAAFDSMGKINVSLLIEELFGFQIDYEILDGAASARALFDLCLAQPA